MGRSLAETLALLPDEERRALLGGLSETQAGQLRKSWKFWRRPEQSWPKGRWRTWLYMGGRGVGKSHTGSGTVIEAVRERGYRRVALLGRTAGDIRVMLEGPSGLLTLSPDDFRPKWIPSQTMLKWPNGAVGYTYSAEKPDQLRGPQHDFAWGDEAAAWRTRDAWDQLSFGLRLPHPEGPRAILTTTPRPKEWLRQVIQRASTTLTRGRTADNAGNLDPAFLREVLERYDGTTLGRQELDGEMFDEAPGALWKRSMVEQARRMDVVPDSVRRRWAVAPVITDDMRDERAQRVREALVGQLERIVVAVDPAISQKRSTNKDEESNETGIVVAGVTSGRKLWVLEDLSDIYSPEAWARATAKAYARWKADRVVAEDNQGGDMVESILRAADIDLPIKREHASDGKRTRAEPVAALYEQGRVYHAGAFSDLEDQLCGWEPGNDSPDRLDALVWAATNLVLRTPSVVAPRLGLNARPSAIRGA